ncbi:glycosyltransferase family 87 protein [Edaphobacter bradus]|uniref:glycosyltransferase family 87 protein n=1 Tax=Edaphobacter bradus TaxID=2259016 RepID=UPI0021DFBC1B|nr:glycosyltransferase family 87 protein [Edaphobacter bradus]
MASEITRDRPVSQGLFQHELSFQPGFETALCAALAIFLFWKGILPAWQALNTDFPNYYLVARLLREGYSLDRIYDWVWLQRIKDHWGLDQSLVGFAGLTPFSALPIVPLSIFSALNAKRIWIVANLIFLATSAELLHRSTSLGRRRIWLLCLLAVLPLRVSFLYGQMHLLVLFLLVLAYYFHHRDQELACGACVAFAGALKVYPLLFLLYFLWKRQWRAALSTLGTAVIIVAVGSLWMGGGLLYTYATQILPRSMQGEVLDPYNLHAASGAALFHRLFLFEPELNPAPPLDSPSLYAILYPLWQMTIFLPLFALLRPAPAEPDREQLEWSAFLIALLVLSPVPSSYHFVVMILSIVLLVDSLLRRNKNRLAALAVTLYFLISAADLVKPSPHLGAAMATSLAFSRLWLGIAFSALFIICLWRYPSGGSGKHSTSRLALLLVSAAVALMLSIAGYRHHFFHRQQEMGHRIPAPSTPYLATQPRPERDGYLFVAMLPDGYRVLDKQGRQLTPQARAQKSPDQLTYAIGVDHSVLLELADAAGSRIVRASDASLVAQDAESPALSADGLTLAFVRETKGRGSLWMSSFDEPQGRASVVPPNSPTHIVEDDNYDVRSASFLRSGALLFLAKHRGRMGLFTVVPGNQPVPFFSADEEIASFSISPDERLVALTELRRNRWQLVSFDTVSRHESVLTSGDCNAYTPAWLTSTTIIYATDCSRGLGLTALASVNTAF